MPSVAGCDHAPRNGMLEGTKVVDLTTAVFGPIATRTLADLAGGLFRLARALGEKGAMELILTSRRISAQEGAEMGLVAEVAPIGGSVEVARRIAQTICEAGPMSIRASKEAVKLGFDMELSEAFAKQCYFSAMRELFGSKDFREGPRALAEKRAPAWRE